MAILSFAHCTAVGDCCCRYRHLGCDMQGKAEQGWAFLGVLDWVLGVWF